MNATASIAGASARRPDHRPAWFKRWLLALCWFAYCHAVAQSPASGGLSAITEITLEQGCFGCAASKLVLRRDGHASFTLSGNVRQGTVDQISVGKLRSGEFDKLARLVVSQGFFEFSDIYEDPEIQDGAWTTTGVTRGGGSKQVFRRNDAGPAGLKAIEDTLKACKETTTFVAERR